MSRRGAESAEKRVPEGLLRATCSLCMNGLGSRISDWHHSRLGEQLTVHTESRRSLQWPSCSLSSLASLRARRLCVTFPPAKMGSYDVFCAVRLPTNRRVPRSGARLQTSRRSPDSPRFGAVLAVGLAHRFNQRSLTRKRGIGRNALPRPPSLARFGVALFASCLASSDAAG